MRHSLASEGPPASGARWFQCGRFRFDLSVSDGRVLVMGVLNLTTDSFSDGGRFLDQRQALEHALSMIEVGADILDIGAESTRPGATSISEEEELRRLLPLIATLKGLGVALSVDTRKPGVMLAALQAGADMINDVEGFRCLTAHPSIAHPGLQTSREFSPQQASLIEAIHRFKAGLCIMHMQGDPLTMQKNPIYRDAVAEVCQFLQTQDNALLSMGVATEQLVWDPGIGFGKSMEHNRAILNRLAEFQCLSRPILIGLSRKSFLGQITGREVEHRLAASIAGALAAVSRGASIVRVHDVAQTVDALKVWRAIHSPSGA
jgi:dihydropteroate synthase